MSTRERLDITTIAGRLERRRLEKRLEQTEVAEQAGLSRAYISRLEKGIVPNPKLFDLAQVAGVLDLSLTELIRPVASGSGSGNEIVIAQATDAVNQLADEPPDVADTILRWLRESIEIARTARLARTN